MLRPNTAVRYARALDLFIRYLEQVHGSGAPLPPSLLTRSLLAEWHTALKHDGLHGRPRQDATRRKLVEVVQLAWTWLYDNDESGAAIPPPRKIRMAREPAAPTVAPTWAEMDACIAALQSWQRDLAVLLRFTGLRVQQAMYLTWDDLDLRARCLRVRGELGKSPQERRGRVLPVSAHLADELVRWPVGDEPWLVLSSRHRGGDRERMARARDLRRAWRRAGVREEAWRGRPHHSFRKGFVSELRRAGADADAVEFLVGHSLGLRGIYTDPTALPLRAAVDLIPPVATQPELATLDREASDQPRFEGLDPDDPRPIREITLDDAGRDDWMQRCPTRVPRRRRQRGNVVFIDTWRRSGGGGGSRRYGRPTSFAPKIGGWSPVVPFRCARSTGLCRDSGLLKQRTGTEVVQTDGMARASPAAVTPPRPPPPAPSSPSTSVPNGRPPPLGSGSPGSSSRRAGW